MKSPHPDAKPRAARWKPRAPIALTIVACLSLTLVTALRRAPEANADVDAVTRPTGLEGAGFQNVVAVDPFGSGVVLSGGDVSGIHRSTDRGDTWLPVNAAFTNSAQLRIASIVFSTKARGRVYAAVGYAGTGGGLFVSDDTGASWRMLAPNLRFAGDSTSAPAGTEHPRATGNLIALDEAAGYIYAGTHGDGLWRSGDGGATWARAGLAGESVRSVVADPADPQVLYVATRTGVYRARRARTDAPLRLASAPGGVEELATIGAGVYAAAGAAGVWASGDGGDSWRQLGGGDVPTGGPVWQSIAGYVDARGQTVLYAGCTGPQKVAGSNPGVYAGVLRSDDGGRNWVPVPAVSSAVSYRVGGTGANWWLSEANRGVMFGQSAYVAAQIAVDPTANSRVFVAGRSGVWRTVDGAASWHPVVAGMGVTMNRAAIADPNAAGRVYVASFDWVFMFSTDAMAHMHNSRPPGGGSVGWSVALDTATTPSRVYLGVGNRDSNTGGEVYSSADPADRSLWISEGLAPSTGGKRVLAVAVNRVAGQPVVVAAVEGSGVWRKAGGSWSRVGDAFVTPTSMKGASISWAKGSRVVYAYDQASGTWRSADAGSTWVNIRRGSSKVWLTGFVAADPTDSRHVFVSDAAGLYRIDGADTGSVDAGTATITKLAVARPGPLAVGRDGVLTVTGRPTWNTTTALYRSGDDGATFTDITDTGYRNAAGFPFDISAGPSGEIYLALNGSGVHIVSFGANSPPSTDTGDGATDPGSDDPADPGSDDPGTIDPGADDPVPGDTDGDGYADEWDASALDPTVGPVTALSGTAAFGADRLSIAGAGFDHVSMATVNYTAPGVALFGLVAVPPSAATAPHSATIGGTGLYVANGSLHTVPFTLRVDDGGTGTDAARLGVGEDVLIDLSDRVTAGDLAVSGG